MRAFPSLIATILCAGGALAGPYDGVFRPNYDFAAGWDCKTVGMDGGAVAIRDGKLLGVENSCNLTNPVEVRGMAATLYDAECMGEGELYSYRVMLMRSDEGVYVVRDGYVADWLRCR